MFRRSNWADNAEKHCVSRAYSHSQDVLPTAEKNLAMTYKVR